MGLDWRLRLLLLADRGVPGDVDATTFRADFERTMRTLRPFATGPGPRMHAEHVLAVGPPGLNARLFRPSAEARAAIVYFHGGGWVVGSSNSYAPFCRALARAVGAVVVAVDYRLAPEHRWPAALDDGVATWRWLGGVGPSLGVDPDRLAIAGDSAGGHLGLLTALEAGGFKPRALVLANPIADADFTTASYLTFATGYGLTAARMRWYWNQFAPDVGSREALSPLRLNLAGLTATLVVTPECDVLHDEGVALVKRLRGAGVPTQHLEVKGVIHGFLVMQRLLPQARFALSQISAFLRGALSL